MSATTAASRRRSSSPPANRPHGGCAAAAPPLARLQTHCGPGAAPPAEDPWGSRGTRRRQCVSAVASGGAVTASPDARCMLAHPCTTSSRRRCRRRRLPVAAPGPPAAVAEAGAAVEAAAPSPSCDGGGRPRRSPPRQRPRRRPPRRRQAFDSTTPQHVQPVSAVPASSQSAPESTGTLARSESCAGVTTNLNLLRLNCSQVVPLFASQLALSRNGDRQADNSDPLQCRRMLRLTRDWLRAALQVRVDVRARALARRASAELCAVFRVPAWEVTTRIRVCERLRAPRDDSMHGVPTNIASLPLSCRVRASSPV